MKINSKLRSARKSRVDVKLSNRTVYVASVHVSPVSESEKREAMLQLRKDMEMGRMMVSDLEEKSHAFAEHFYCGSSTNGIGKPMTRILKK